MTGSSDAVGGICRILIVDDHGPWRDVVGSILKSEPGFHVIGEAADGFEAIQRAATLSPDIILMDIGLPGVNGLEAARCIRELLPACRVLFFSELRSRDIVVEALRIGGCGYVVKSYAAGELIPAFQAVLAGAPFLSAGIVDLELIQAMAKPSHQASPADANPFVDFGRSVAIPEFLDSAIDATRADFGDVQLFDSSSSALKMVAQCGHSDEFLKRFEVVDCTSDCLCARAMKSGLRLIIKDYSSDPLVSNEVRSLMRRARVRSAQSTPLIASSFRFIGIVTTHYTRPGGPLPEVLPKLDDLAARFLATLTS